MNADEIAKLSGEQVRLDAEGCWHIDGVFSPEEARALAQAIFESIIAPQHAEPASQVSGFAYVNAAASGPLLRWEQYDRRSVWGYRTRIGTDLLEVWRAKVGNNGLAPNWCGTVNGERAFSDESLHRTARMRLLEAYDRLTALRMPMPRAGAAVKRDGAAVGVVTDAHRENDAVLVSMQISDPALLAELQQTIGAASISLGHSFDGLTVDSIEYVGPARDQR